jgi:hypothetical protein
MRRHWKWAVVGVAVAALGTGGYFGYWQLVRYGVLKYNKWDRREQGSLEVGARAPDMELVATDGRPARLSAFWTDRPLFLVFGSCT